MLIDTIQQDNEVFVEYMEIFEQEKSTVKGLIGENVLYSYVKTIHELNQFD